MDINSIKAKLSALQTQQSRPSGEARKNVFWKPAVGKQTIRIVPSAYNKSNPFSELYFHYGIDKNQLSTQQTGMRKILSLNSLSS